MKPQRILVVDDERDVCRLLRRLLEADGYSVLTQCDPRKVLGLLRKGDFDVLLLDLAMPQLSGLELLAQIRLEFAVLPIIVVTGHTGLDIAVEAMRSGASDFVTKPIDPILLELRMERAFDLERARRLANTDGLTGLYNHRFFQERLQEEVDRSQRYDRPLSLIMADLDGFKAYNDTYGHPRGDEVLMGVADIMRQVSRAADVLARYGGEEFCLILPETTGEQAEIVAKRLRDCMAGLEFSWEDGSLGAPTVSLGVSAHRPGGSKEALISEADAALYRSKRQGGDRVSRCEGDAPRPLSLQLEDVDLPT